MSRNIDSMWPLIRKDFSKAVDRRKDPRNEPAFELYFRDVSTGIEPSVTFADQIYNRQN